MRSSETPLPFTAAPDRFPALKTRTFTMPVRRFFPAGARGLPPPARELRDAAGHTVALTDSGPIWRHPDGAAVRFPTLPISKLTCVAAAPDGTLWFGGPKGAVHWTPHRAEYYAGPRWLPHDSVIAIACEPDGTWIATERGISHIRFETMDMMKKAQIFEQDIDARHRRFGFVAAAEIAGPEPNAESKHQISDNDGLWTAMYLAAEAFRFAVTREDEAKTRARESMQALLQLESITGIPGFPARAVTHESEPEFGNHPDGEWHLAANPEWEWKGDTSSDELDGHYFAWAVYYDLVADPRERNTIRKTVARVTEHIIQNGFYLVDLDGKPTRWGVWAPEKLNHDPQWRAERGLNSLEILAYLNVAWHITGKQRFRNTALTLIHQHHYALNTIEQKILPGDYPGAENNHSDDELAFLAYYALLAYEPDPELRRIYLASLRRSWEIERPEACPLWNFIYGALSGEPCDAEAALIALETIPLDLRCWRTQNSHRQDVQINPEPDRAGRPQALSPLPWTERPMHKWNGNPYRLDGGNDREEQAGTFWLLPWWMGRYHRILV